MFALVGAGLNLTVLGVHSLSADEARFRQFFCAYVNEPMIEGSLEDYDAQLYHNARQALLVEVLVTDCDADFDAEHFVEKNERVAESFWQVAWNETYLSEDGSAVIAGYPRPVRPNLPSFRIAFYIHSQDNGLPLFYQNTLLNLPLRTTMPERLWELVPYELP